MGEDTKPIGIRIPISIYQELKGIAHNKGISFTDIAIEAFIQYLDNSIPGLCPTCHTQNDPDAQYCQKCGTPLTEESTRKQEGLRVLAQNPELIKELIQELENRPEFKTELNELKKQVAEITEKMNRIHDQN